MEFLGKTGHVLTCQFVAAAVSFTVTEKKKLSGVTKQIASIELAKELVVRNKVFVTLTILFVIHNKSNYWVNKKYCDVL